MQSEQRNDFGKKSRKNEKKNENKIFVGNFLSKTFLTKFSKNIS